MAFSRMIWAGSTPPPPPPVVSTSWDLWFTWNSGVSIIEVINFDNINAGYNTIIIRKLSDKIAYYAIVKTTHNGDDCYTALFMSTASDAVGYGVADDDAGTYTEYGYKGTVTASDGTTWYWAGFDWFGSTSVYEPWDDQLWGYNEDLLLSTTSYSNGNDAAQDMVDMIFAVPIVGDYQGGQTYSIDFSTLANSEKMLRKAIGAWLFLNISLYSSELRYQALCQNVFLFISEILTRQGNSEWLHLDSFNFYDNYLYCYLYANYTNTELNSKQLRCNTYDPTQYGFDSYRFGSVSASDTLRYNYVTVKIDSQGTVTSSRSTSTDRLSTFIMGLEVNSSTYSVRISNLGIDL